MQGQIIIDRLNQAFNTFWNQYQSIPIYYKEQDLDFTHSDIKNQDHVVLVYPNLSSGNRASLGKVFNQRTEILFSLRLYTSNKLGNIPHQSVLNKIIDFFPKTEIAESSLRGSAIITGPIQLPEIESFIVSTVTGTYYFDENQVIS